MQKIHNLDHTKINLQSPNANRETEFYSDKSPIVDLEHEDERNELDDGGASFKPRLQY